MSWKGPYTALARPEGDGEFSIECHSTIKLQLRSEYMVLPPGHYSMRLIPNCTLIFARLINVWWCCCGAKQQCSGIYLPTPPLHMLGVIKVSVHLAFSKKAAVQA